MKIKALLARHSENQFPREILKRANTLTEEENYKYIIKEDAYNIGLRYEGKIIIEPGTYETVSISYYSIEMAYRTRVALKIMAATMRDINLVDWIKRNIEENCIILRGPLHHTPLIIITGNMGIDYEYEHNDMKDIQDPANVLFMEILRQNLGIKTINDAKEVLLSREFRETLKTFYIKYGLMEMADFITSEYEREILKDLKEIENIRRYLINSI